MSFILDALKKSENERQRADAPALYEMKMAPPKRGVAVWLVVLAGLLVVNIVVLSVVLLRGSHGTTPAAETSPAPFVAPPAPTGISPAAQPPQLPAQTAPVPAQDTVITPPDVTAAAPPASTTRPSEDDVPAVDAPRPTAAAQSPPARPTATEDLRSYDEAASAPGVNLPDLKLDLHAYATNPADRFVFLNMLKLREGQSTPQGVRVEAITPEGAVLSWQGQRFLLRSQ